MKYDGIEALGLALVGSLSKDYRLAFERGDEKAMSLAKEGLEQFSAALPCSVEDFINLIETHVKEIK